VAIDMCLHVFSFLFQPQETIGKPQNAVKKVKLNLPLYLSTMPRRRTKVYPKVSGLSR
jgi:hypothetical protein